MAESENRSNNCETVKISIGTIIKKLKIIAFVSDHLKIKKKYENAVKKFIRYGTTQRCWKIEVNS